MAEPHCKIHTDVELICPSCFAAKGGAATAGITSKAKAKSSARNGRLGGRPKLPKHRRSCKREALGAPDPACAGCEARAR